MSRPGQSHESTLKDLAAAIRAIRDLPATPAVAAFLVAPDVWDYIKDTVPQVRGHHLIDQGPAVGPIKVFRSESLPPGTWVPLDEHGVPLTVPTKEL